MPQEITITQENLRPYERLVEAVSVMEYGEPITHEMISSIIGERMNTNRYRSAVSKAAKILQRRSKKIESIRGIGYRVVRPTNYIDHSVTHVDRSRNEIAKAKEILENVPINELTVEDRAVVTRVKDRVTLLHASMSGSSVEVKTLARRNNPLLPENTNRR